MFKEKLLTQEQLEERLAYWQQCLRLQDWIVTVKIVRGPVLGDSLAKVSPQLSKKMALIQLSDPIDYAPDCMKPYDMESSLVHELLHLHLYPLTKDLGDCVEEEQAIESIEYGFIMLADQLSDRDLALVAADVEIASLKNQVAALKVGS